MQIHVQVRNKYGRQLIYPVNQAAHDLAEVAKTTTLAPLVLKLARKLGHEIVEVQSRDLEELLNG